MRRAWLRGRENVHKRYLIHVAGFNLGILMRALFGSGTPREAASAKSAILFVIQFDAALARHRGEHRRQTSNLVIIVAPETRGSGGAQTRWQLMQCTATGDERDAIEGRHAAVMSRARLALVCKRWHVVLEADCLVREVVPGHANQVISPERATSIETARNLHWSAHRTRFQREFASVFEAVPDLLHSLYMGDHCPFLTAATGLVCERLAYYFGRGELVGKVSAGTKWSPLTADDLVKAGWTTPVDHWDFLSGLSPHGHDVTVPGTRWHGVRFRMTSAADARSMSKTPELKREAAAGKLKEMVKTYYFKNKEAFDYATRGQKTPRYTKHGVAKCLTHIFYNLEFDSNEYGGKCDSIVTMFNRFPELFQVHVNEAKDQLKVGVEKWSAAAGSSTGR